MKDNQDLELEFMLLHSILSGEYSFMSAAAVNPPAEIFSNPFNRVIFSEAMSFFLKTGHAPTTEKIYECLVVKNSNPELREHFIHRILGAEYAEKADTMVKALTEKKIESEIRNYMKSAPARGLDMAMELMDYINKTLQKYIGGCVRAVKNIDVAENALKDIHNAMQGKFNNYIPTLIPDLDSQVLGIPKKHISVIAARPGMGKTDLMLQLMRNFMKQGLNPCIFSLEMEAQGLLLRNISEAAGIDSMKIENGQITAAEFKNLTDAAKKYSDDDYLIDDSAVETAEMIKAKINYWRLKRNVNVIMIDYVTLITTNYRQERYDLEIGSLVRDLRVFAKETEIPIIILSQLNRDSEKRLNHRPHISDLRESGSIEQEASLVMLLYRPAEYGIDPFEGKGFTYYDSSGNQLQPEDYMEIIVAKSRSGRTGTIPVKYTPAVHCIEGLTRGSAQSNVQRPTSDVETDITF